MAEVSPSILSADFANLADALSLIREGGASMVHVDVMDGHFVPNITIGPPVVASIRKATDRVLDCHLMVRDPEQYAPRFQRVLRWVPTWFPFIRRPRLTCIGCWNRFGPAGFRLELC